MELQGIHELAPKIGAKGSIAPSVSSVRSRCIVTCSFFLSCTGCLQVEYDQVGSAYAAALLELAKDKDLLEAVHTDVDSLQVI